MHLLIRRLAPDDWQAFRNVRLRSLRDAPEAFASRYEDALAFDEHEWRQGVMVPSWLATWDGEPVGVVRIVDRDDALPHLISMWVAPVARGSTAARRLVEAALEWARSMGHAGVALHVVTSNARAQSFYRKCGFVANGITFVLADGRPEIGMEHLFARQAPDNKG